MKLLLATVVSVGMVANLQAAGRDTISVVGSSTVYPFATVVAEKFGKKTSFNTPKIESTGSGGGMKLFCSGLGLKFPDITNASRAMKKSELDTCRNNGVTDITEIHIGYDGIAIANSNKAPLFKLTRKDLFLALARQVPNPDGSEALVDNPYKTWQEVNDSLPATKIEVLGPPPTSGTRDAFAELALEGGCQQFGWIKAMKKADKKAYKSVCHSVREDGPYIEVGENDNLIVQKLEKNPNALGIFGYSFLEQNDDKVQGSIIENKSPEFETIADGSYPVSRPLFFYVKNAHKDSIPGMRAYLKEFTSEAAMGEDGYLLDKGLIPLSDSERAALRDNVMSGKKLVIK
ncbi:MAG: PstS family phosphate ABC transporter substrate-binding protein [Gammaproteobacteria bacterium]|nr:PstS family phosphate ABC transporter substrate-binding protein [Gammaproteobacteria bacterium]